MRRMFVSSVLKIILVQILCAQSLENWENVKIPRLQIKLNNVGIIGGQEVKPHSIPFQVGLSINNNQYFCGGALISENYVLTAAHCGILIKSVDIILGAHNLTNSAENTQVKIVGENVIVHENYNTDKFTNDIALIQLSNPVTLNENIQPAKLPNGTFTYEGQIARASGWGLTKDGLFATKSDVLKAVDVQVLSLDGCKDYYNDQDNSYVTKTNICTSGYRNKGTCNGDSGGPLTLGNGVLIGLTSFGTELCEMCSPSVYTNVGEYLDWIEANSKSGV